MSEIALLGKKIGMTREFYKSGQLVPVTVLKVEKARVIQVIEEEKRGYKAVQLGYGKIKNSKLTKAMKGVFAKKNTNCCSRFFPSDVQELLIPITIAESRAGAGESHFFYILNESEARFQYVLFCPTALAASLPPSMEAAMTGNIEGSRIARGPRLGGGPQ